MSNISILSSNGECNKFKLIRASASIKIETTEAVPKGVQALFNAVYGNLETF